jgi:hypothetical protein
MEWIKCSERLPKNEEMVLVFGKMELGVECLIAMARLRNNEWDINGDIGWNPFTDSYWHYEGEQITHWMLLPEPPK